MFKYLPITTSLQEMMIMLNSLPTCSIVLDLECRIVEINKPALDFLGIESKNDYRLKRISFLNDLNYIKRIQKKLITGHVIRDQNFLVNCANGQSRLISFNACAIEGVSKMFIFQFFDLAILPNSYAEFLMTRNNMCEAENKLLDESNEKKQQYDLSKHMILFVRKYSKLTYNEIVICTLIAADMSVTEISKKTNKLTSNIHGSIHRIMNKFKLESRQDLYERLKIELTNVCD